MKLYEINSEIAALLDKLEPDPETGEIPFNEKEIIDWMSDRIPYNDGKRLKVGVLYR